MKQAVVFTFIFLFIQSSFSQDKKVRGLNFSYDTKTEISADSSATYSVATYDQRPVVLDGSQKEDFVGYSRSTTAIAYPVSTASGNIFSTDFSTSIANSLLNPAQAPIIVPTSSDETKDAIIEKLVDTKSDRLLLITLYKWRTDSKAPPFSKMRTELIWDVLLEVYDINGDLIASNRIEGFNPKMHETSGTLKKVRPVVTANFEKKLVELFDTPEIKSALIN